MNYIIQGDAIDGIATLPDKCVHTCVTSPPYYGLRDYGVEGQIGLEDTPDAYVARLVEVFREVRRVLRDDGTLWLNLGDSYNAYNGNRGTDSKYAGEREKFEAMYPSGAGLLVKSLKQKDLIGIPWRVAFALQADGWYLRQDIIWHKPNPMPESVTDRCTKAHEYIFLLAKSARYYYDAEAVKEPAVGQSFHDVTGGKYHPPGQADHSGSRTNLERIIDGTRNRRSVWTVTTKPYAEAHFATFPPDLIEPCILAGAPAQACPQCGAPYARVIEKETSFEGGSGRAGRTAEDVNESGKWRNGGEAGNKNLKLGPTVRSKTVDFQPTCTCGLNETVPGLVLDPFMGSGTTGATAISLGRRYVGTELNPEYIKLATTRIRKAAEQPDLFFHGGI